jgi:hypothetical protein
MTGRSLDAYLGHAFLGDSLATIVSAFGGGTGVTTYAENIGVMAATKVYSTVLLVIAFWNSAKSLRMTASHDLSPTTFCCPRYLR